MKEECEIITVESSSGVSRYCKVHGLSCFEVVDLNPPHKQDV